MKPEQHIAKYKLEHGAYYKGDCRNASIARWDAVTQKFWYIRSKFHMVYTEEINHPEDDDGHDLFYPFERVEGREDGVEIMLKDHYYNG